MTKQNTEYQLYLEDVYVKYKKNKNKEFTVLNDIDLKVSEGEFITVIGPSGCGKSTLLRLILGSEQPHDGTILFQGKKIISPDRSRGIVFQKYSLFPHLTVLENLVFGLDAESFSMPNRFSNPFKYKKSVKIFREKSMEYLKKIGMENDGNKYPSQLSGGMRQRVAIAQAMIMEPEILLMDEPFGALDDSTRQAMQMFILEQWEKTGMTVFFVTHDLEEAVFLGSRCIVLSQYYKTDETTVKGAKIVTDIPLTGDYPRTSEYKYSKEMNQFIKKLRYDGLNPEHKQHISEFDLRHVDSFRTVTENEWKGQNEKKAKK